MAVFASFSFCRCPYNHRDSMRVHSLPWRLSTKTKLPVEYIKQTRRGGRKEPLGGRKWSVDRIWFSVGSVFGPRGAHPDVCKLASVARRHAVDSDVFPPHKIKRRQLSATQQCCVPPFLNWIRLSSFLHLLKPRVSPTSRRLRRRADDVAELPRAPGAMFFLTTS